MRNAAFRLNKGTEFRYLWRGGVGAGNCAGQSGGSQGGAG
jgi:hypothetical protein